MAGLHVPLPTLRRHPRGCLRTARGRRGLLLLHHSGLSPLPPYRSPGARPDVRGQPALAPARDGAGPRLPAIPGPAGRGDRRATYRRRPTPRRTPWRRRWPRTTRISDRSAAQTPRPICSKNGLLFLSAEKLTDLLDQTIDAQPFLGQLAADPTARGLFSALSLLGQGVTSGDADLTPYLGALRASTPPWRPRWRPAAGPLSWQRLLSGRLADLAGRYRFVLVQPKLDFGALEPGGAATQAMREAAAKLEFVRSRRRPCAHHRPGGAGGRGVRHRRAGRGRGADRQRRADHALAVPGGADLAADRADPADARCSA